MTLDDDPIPPGEAEFADTPEMAEAAAAVQRDTLDMQRLDRLAELAMELAEAVAARARASLEGPTAGGPTSAVDPTGPFHKMAQTVRRIIALKGRLAQPLHTARAKLTTERAARRAELEDDHREEMEADIRFCLSIALEAEFPDLEKKEVERLLRETEDRLLDGDEFEGYLDRPVGETVARLCVAMGLGPDACVLDGETWKLRRPPPRPFEGVKRPAAQANAPAPLPPFPAASLPAAATGPPG